MGTFRFCSKFECVGKLGDAVDIQWNLIGQSGCKNSILYPGFNCSHNYTMSGVKQDRRKVK